MSFLYNGGMWCNGNTQDFDSCVVGSSPAIPAWYAPVAQQAEHLPFKQGVRGSNPRWSTKKHLGFNRTKVLFLFVFRLIEQSPEQKHDGKDQYQSQPEKALNPVTAHGSQQQPPLCSCPATASGDSIDDKEQIQ